MVRETENIYNCQAVRQIFLHCDIFSVALLEGGLPYAEDFDGKLNGILTCHSVSPFRNSNAYAKESKDKSKFGILVIHFVVFKKQTLFRSIGGFPSAVLKILAKYV